MQIHDPIALLRRLVALTRESEWVEFKVGKFSAEAVGKYVSALANSAIFCGVDAGYLVWGVEDATHKIVGTDVRIDEEMVGSDTFLFWLSGRMSPRINIEHKSLEIEGKRIEILAVDPSYQQPVRFNHEAFVRVDTSIQPLRAHPERERAIWQATSRFAFEQTIAKSHCGIEFLYDEFDIEGLFSRLGINRPSVANSIEYLVQERLLRDNNQGGFDVTNLLVLTASKQMKNWDSLSRKPVRVVQYKDKSKLTSIADVQGGRGYGISFNAMLKYVMDRVSHREVMQHGQRVTVYDIPQIAVREIVANAIIHQDLTASGDGPVVEIYPDKIKVTNPGKPLIPTDRFIDSPSRSRNSAFGKLMRRLGLCEERGSGVDRALDAVEKAALPAPLFQEVADATVVTLFGPKQFADMTREDRIRACYQHSCLGFERNDFMSNSSLRNRFGLSDRQYSQVSLVIGEAREAGLVRPLDEDQAKRNARYVPYWA